MSSIELKIKIDNKLYEKLLHPTFDVKLVVNEIQKAIINGVLLSKSQDEIKKR